MRVPRPLADEPELVLVDSTWGTIQPIELAAGVRTVGERELIAHLEAGGRCYDTRPKDAFAASTIPGAVSLPHDRVESGHEPLASSEPAVFFCNGPQCAATPHAVAALLAAGHPPGAILYYRGGMHDWITLGLPVEAPGAPGARA